MNDISKENSQFRLEDYTRKEILKPQHTALLVVDMQADFLSPQGKFAGWGRDISQMQSTVPHIQGLVDAAHKARITVIFTQGSEDVKSRQPGPDLWRAVEWGEKDGDGSVNSEKGTPGWEFYGVRPQEGDIVIEKHKWSAFDGQDSQKRSLKQILDHLEVKTLVVAGVVAETCMETTVRDAYSQNYIVIIPRNSVGSNDSEQLRARMRYWEKGFVGNTMEESEIKEHWT